MIILDTETTGLLLPQALTADKQPRIIDLACVQLDPYTGEEVNRFETLLNPDQPITDEITRITGYTDADVRAAPRFADVLPGLVEFFLGENSFLAHNLPFDKGMLYWELVRVDAVTAFPWPGRQFCTVQLYVDEFGKFPKLTQLYERKLGRPLDQKHTAMADVEALVEIVRAERLYELGQ